RVRLHRLRLEFRMKLAAEKPWVIGKLADLDVRAVGSLTGNPQARGPQPLFVLAVELVAMAMALVDFARSVRSIRETVLHQLTGPASQPHSAAEIVDAFQFAQLENHAMRGARVELGGIGRLQAAHVARKLDYQCLHPEADAEVRHFPFARETNAVQH